MDPGVLVVLEGIDGSGKTTALQALAAWLEAAGREVLCTREPWDSEPGRTLRRLLAQKERTSTGEEELELFHADRREHVTEVVRPALERGRWVLHDRTFYSTASYQGPRGVSVQSILTESRKIAPEPDLTVLLQIEPERALERIRTGRDSLSSFERLESLRQVDHVYRELAAAVSTMVSVNADQPPAEVLAAICAAGESVLGDRWPQ